jgi:hypothetical protein
MRAAVVLKHHAFEQCKRLGVSGLFPVRSLRGDPNPRDVAPVGGREPNIVLARREADIDGERQEEPQLAEPPVKLT